MVMRSSGIAKKLPSGTLVKFPKALEDQDVQKGDVGTLKHVVERLPRGRGAVTTYYVEFDDGTQVQVEGNTHFWVEAEAPEVTEKRREGYRRFGRRVSRFIYGDPDKPAPKQQPHQETRQEQPKQQQGDDEFWLGSTGKHTKEDDPWWGEKGQWKDPLA